MIASVSRMLDPAAEIRRVEMLFARLPSSIVAALIGIFLCFTILFEPIGLEALKGWAVYMLTVLAVRVWIWYMFGKADRQGADVRRWEWLFACGAFFSSLGWGALFGPLHPPVTAPDAQRLVILVVVAIAFAGTVFLALSNVAFWLFVIPLLLPPLVYYASTTGHPPQWASTTAVGGIVVLILVQRTLHRSFADNIQRSSVAESLLAEQQAIFESSPMGIVVIDGRQLVKCNARLGELLGCRIQDLTAGSLQEHFVNDEEAKRFLSDRAIAFEKGHLAQGMYRLRRADGSQLWAEFSGRKMPGAPSSSVWMIADVTLRVAGDRRAVPRDNV